MSTDEIVDKAIKDMDADIPADGQSPIADVAKAKRAAILTLLTDHRIMDTTSIANGIGHKLGPGTLGRLLTAMLLDGHIMEVSHRRYSATLEGMGWLMEYNNGSG